MISYFYIRCNIVMTEQMMRKWIEAHKDDKVMDLSNRDVSNVGNMFNMLYGCQSLDLSNWNVSNVKDMSSMICQCGSLKELDLTDCDVSNVESMTDMLDH